MLLSGWNLYVLYFVLRAFKGLSTKYKAYNWSQPDKAQNDILTFGILFWNTFWGVSSEIHPRVAWVLSSHEEIC